MCLIKLKNISYSYNKNEYVFNDINLKIQAGSFFSLLGPSGCGKSTLLKITASMIIPESGTLFLKNIETTSPDPDRVIVLQDDNQLFPWLTAGQNISFPMKLLKKDNIESHTDLLLKNVFLENYKDFYPSQLSGGMKKRAIIARALSSDPEILLLDEPFSSLDIQTRVSLHKLIYRIWVKRGITVIFVTHDIDEALSLSTDIAVMNSRGCFTDIFKNSCSGNFNSFTPEYFIKRQELMDLIESPDFN